MLFAVVFVPTFIFFAFVGFVVMSIPRSWGIFLAFALLLIGLVLVQPEFDFLGFGALIFMFYPSNRRALGAKPQPGK